MMKRVLITGASGFVGSAVVRRFVSQGRKVAVLLRPSSEARRIQDLLGQVTVIRGDLSRLDDAREQIAAFGPQGVAHIAWDGVKGADRNSPIQLTNVSTSIALYRLTEELGCRNFVGLGSQAEYGPLPGKIHESAPTRPTTVYGAAKLATCLMLERSAAASGRPFAWLRLFSSYGPDDDPSWLVPYVIRTLLARQKPSLTRAEQIWDYIHVDDVAGAVMAALDREARGVFNLGSGQARPLREIIAFLRDCIDPSLPLGFGEVAYRPDQVMHLEAEMSAFEDATGWKPSIPLEDGLSRVVEWYRNEMRIQKA